MIVMLARQKFFVNVGVMDVMAWMIVKCESQNFILCLGCDMDMAVNLSQVMFQCNELVEWRNLELYVMILVKCYVLLDYIQLAW